jgi:phosphoribosyl-ATP pyrophosphohydrolase
MSDVLSRLARVVEARQGADGEASYVASLLAGGAARCAEKFGEEAIDAVVAAVRGERAHLTAEAADVLFHLLVMLTAGGVTLEDVLEELARREGVSGHDEKLSRGKSGPG